MATKVCKKCASSFQCEEDRDCWCEKLNLHNVQMIEILERYTDCICPDCMKEYEAKE